MLQQFWFHTLTGEESEFKEFAPLLKKVKGLISGNKPMVIPQRLQAIYFIIDSMKPLHGTGFDLFGAIYENFANSKEKKILGNILQEDITHMSLLNYYFKMKIFLIQNINFRF